MAGKQAALPLRAATPRDRSPDSEKITINLGLVDLGQIDLLVVEGFYSNRTDFIRTAIRNQLSVHAEPIRQTIARKTLVVGLRDVGKQELEQVAASGKKLQLHVLGLIRIADDVSPRLARAAIESLEILGALAASPKVKAALADRIL
jgi:Arc/MetJ-type ribon-helix-helix transcriptional regulator